jgi:hypothetical protein
MKTLSQTFALSSLAFMYLAFFLPPHLPVCLSLCLAILYFKAEKIASKRTN